MPKSRLFAFLLATALAAAAPAALPRTPDEAIARFIELNNRQRLDTPEGKQLRGGELARLEGRGGGKLPPADKIVRAGPGRAVARVPARKGETPDFYFTLEQKGEAWLVTAGRALAMTGILEEMIRLDRESPSPDPEVRRAIRNAKLVLSSDAELLAWAAANRDLLDRVRAEPGSPEIGAAVEAAGAAAVAVEDGGITVTIGGLVDNEVGFLWAPEGKAPPIDGSRYIWVEPVGDGWYLFRTT